jgi:hypothetical protein
MACGRRSSSGHACGAFDRRAKRHPFLLGVLCAPLHCLRYESSQAATKFRWAPFLGLAFLRQPGACVPPGGKEVETQIQADKKE